MQDEGKTAFSVVMTSYNVEKYVAQAVQSVLAQEYDGERELIVVDDCSTDRSLEEIRRAVKRFALGWEVTILQTPHNLGVAGACDFGWARARHDWIVMVDGDDIQYANRLALTNRLLRAFPHVVMLVGSADYADSSGKVYGYMGCCGEPYDCSPESSSLSTPEARLKNFLLSDGSPRWAPFGCCMAMKRSIFTRWGPITQSCGEERIAQDPTWYMRALLSGSLLNTRQPLCKYRTRESNIINRAFNAARLSECYAREYHMQRFYGLNLRNYAQQIRDIRRALQDGSLSDLSHEQLKALETHILSKKAAYEILEGWWRLSWFKRLHLALHNPLPSNFARWPWPRLLPFPAFVFARWAVGRIRG